MPKSQGIYGPPEELKRSSQKREQQAADFEQRISEQCQCMSLAIQTLYEQKMDKIEKIIFPEGLTGNKSELETAIKEYLKRAVEGFKKLENDHKKLIKHCAVIQK